MLVEQKPEIEFKDGGATLLLLGVPLGTRIGIDTQGTSILSTPYVDSNLLLGDVNGTQMSYSHKSTSSLKGRFSSSMPGSILSVPIKVEAEPLANDVTSDTGDNIHTIKSEFKGSFDFEGDKLDHVPFKERIRMLMDGLNNESNHTFEDSKKFSGGALSRDGGPLKSKCMRKRKKTATASAHTALEEDAPGLLRVLVEKGVMLDEIRLYDGQMDDDDLSDDSLPEDSFSDLEDVMSKIFMRNASVLRFAPIRLAKGSRTLYCLECLMALVDQAKYLELRKWPVEWGWCRDLQSFVFVFKRHNRIVLERPEYGYATYFFEIVASLPISWQIKRLVIAMKLTNCRLNILENKILEVGKELSEAEARVLMQYGWMPNTGLGTMLNYCDRVYHDGKTEKYNSCEWKSKIGKLLVSGYNGGSIISITYLGDFGTKCTDVQDSQIKLEI